MIFDKLSGLGVREKVGLSVAVLFVVGLLLDRLVIRSVVNRLGVLDARIEAEEQDLRYTLSVAQHEPAVAETYQALVAALGASQPPPEAIAAMKAALDDMARRTGVVLISLEHREPRQDELCENCSVEIASFEAGVSNLVSFLHAVQNAPGMLRVVRLDLAPGKAENTAKGSMVVTRMMIREGVM